MFKLIDKRLHEGRSQEGVLAIPGLETEIESPKSKGDTDEKGKKSARACHLLSHRKRHYAP